MELADFRARNIHGFGSASTSHRKDVPFECEAKDVTEVIDQAIQDAIDEQAAKAYERWRYPNRQTSKKVETSNLGANNLGHGNCFEVLRMNDETGLVDRCIVDRQTGEFWPIS